MPGTGKEPAVVHAQVRDLIDLRLSRHRLFEDNLFFDPVWDMLLELYAAKLAGRCLSLADLCILSRVPTSTALRWVELLERNGWVTRKTSSNDGARCLVMLSSKALAAMEQFFSQPTARSGV
jgi:DNA-binding MarR family transcriptional regulator